MLTIAADPKTDGGWISAPGYRTCSRAARLSGLARSDFVLWHFSAMPPHLSHVGCRGLSEPIADIAIVSDLQETQKVKLVIAKPLVDLHQSSLKATPLK